MPQDPLAVLNVAPVAAPAASDAANLNASTVGGRVGKYRREELVYGTGS